ncbi:MAG: hypothetical protein R3A50_13825 [Saprospiraceae bacterium]
MPEKVENNAPVIIGFINRLAPPLKAGKYQISVESVFGKDKLPLPETYGTAQKLIQVGGKRFGFDATDIDSVYPPANGVGEYDTAVPHIVFHRKGIPWERSTSDGHDACPWLGLLIFDQNDPAPKIQEMKLADLDKSSIPDGVYFPDFELEPVEDPDTSCQIIDVPLALFQEIKPNLDDLSLLAHSRVVEMEHKAIGELNAFLQISNPSKEDKDKVSRSLRLELTYKEEKLISVQKTYSVIMGNRLPKPGMETIVHLVSFENYGDVMDEKWDGGHYHAVRVISLRNWRFSSENKGGSFHQFFRKLNTDFFDLEKNPKLEIKTESPLLLHYPFPTQPGRLKKSFQLLQLGFIPMEHRFRQGLKSVSWFRSPLTPCLLPELKVMPLGDYMKVADERTSGEQPKLEEMLKGMPLPASSADALLIYDPETGYYDVSYASAWQLGQLLALKNKSFSKALYFWKNKMGINARKALERRVLREAIPVLVNDKTTFGEASLDFQYDEIEKLIDATSSEILEPADTQSAESLQDRFQITDEPEANEEVINNLSFDETGDFRIIRDYLNTLRNTRAIPYNYLVLHPDMLPPESIRLFYIDPNWISALVDGACSIGDFMPQEKALKGKLNKDQKQDQYTGFLLRSGIIKTWPGVEVKVKVSGSDEYKRPIRFERLAEDQIICIVTGLISNIEFKQPPEGLHFGMSEVNYDNKGVEFIKNLRDGGQIIKPKPNARGRLDIAGIAKEVFGKEVNSADFAFSMIQNPHTVRLELNMEKNES